MTKERIKKIRQLLVDARCDALLIVNNEESGQPNTRYVSGFSGSHSYVLLTPKSQYIITDGRYFLQAVAEAKEFKLIKIGTSPLKTVLRSVLERDHVASLLIDSERTSYEMLTRIKKELRGVKIIPHLGLLHQLRLVKEPEEVRHLAKAADISCRAFNALLSEIKPGVTEMWLSQRLEFMMRELGADAIAFETIVASGKNGARPHAKLTTKKIRKGELITIDFGASYKGYKADMTRTVALGNVSSRLRDVYDAVEKAQALGCEQAVAGVTGRDLDALCRSYLESRGYGKYFLHSTGHGLGMEVHELPYVSPGYLKPLPEGSVITCEPGVYIEGLGGVRIEDALVLTKRGNINLNKKISKKLLIL